MNLATEPWIPVLSTDGSRDLVSLEQVFADAERIRDLAVRPHERIALMRLLLGVAHAGLNGPNNHNEWLSSQKRIAPSALKHLRSHYKMFDLFGNGPRFGQLYSGTGHAPRPSAKDPIWASKLELVLATGNNPTVFDNAGVEAREFKPLDLARMLVTYQAFSPLVGRGYKGRSPCVEANMLHTLLRGHTLLESIWLNLLDRETVEETYGQGAWGQPIWLRMPANRRDSVAIVNATRTHLGRLCPLPRAIWLVEDFRTIALDNGLVYPAWTGEPAEPTATTGTPAKRERKVLAARLDRATWRVLPALATKRRSDAARGALAWQRFPEDRPCDFWVGALVTDGKAKVLDSVESTFRLPKNAGNDDFLNFYSGGVTYAEDWATAIEKGLKVYRRRLGDNLGLRQARKRARLLKQKAVSLFWTAIEAGARDTLIGLCMNPPDELKCAQPFYLDYSGDESRWGSVVRRAAKDAFALACPRATARQAIAFGEGRLEMLRRQPRLERSTD
jgi:CRISPR system Cascade subunit CasA